MAQVVDLQRLSKSIADPLYLLATMHHRVRNLALPLVLGMLACSGESPSAPSSQISAPNPSHSAAGDADGDGFALPSDCLDSGALWASGAAPCDESTSVVFRPSDGQNAKDFTFIQATDGFHLFHIRGLGSWGSGENETTFGHESSEDLLNWSFHPPLDLRGPTGSWNDRNLWSPHIVAINGLWHMFYTGVSYGADRAENLQRIGLATSSDLFHWTPAATTCAGVGGSGCLLDCEALWSSWGSGAPYTGDCRDPWVIPYDGGYVMFLTARLLNGKEVIARASSQDALQWSLLAPIPITIGSKAESPALLVRNGNYELYWSAANGVHVATASDPLADFSGDRWLFYGFAAELVPAPGASYWLPFVDGAGIVFQRLFWNASSQATLSNVVSPLCAIPAQNIHPGNLDPINGIDDNCDGYVDLVHLDPPYAEREGFRPKLRFASAARGRF